MHKNKHIPRIFHLNIKTNNILSNENSLHLVKVLRLSHLSSFYIFNNIEGEFLAELLIQKKTCSFQIVKKLHDVEQEKFKINLYYSPLKSTAHDFLIEKTVELGISSLTQVTLDYTNIKPISEEKLLTKSIESAKQCGRIRIPTINKSITFQDMISIFQLKKTSKLFYFHNNAKDCLKDALSSNLGIKEGSIDYLIGAEGGFSDNEDKELMMLSNTKKVKLTDNILRAETASISALISFKLLLDV